MKPLNAGHLLGFALWEGGDSRLGKTAWQSVDSMALSGVVANATKPVFGRQRPTQTDDPIQWFKGGGSFPSGEVATITGIVTPYILEDGHDYPAVWALELPPAYDAAARMKSRASCPTASALALKNSSKTSPSNPDLTIGESSYN